MIDKFIRAIDAAAQVARETAVTPIQANIEYTAGLRIGISQGIATARAAVLNAFKDTNEKDNDL